MEIKEVKCGEVWMAEIPSAYKQGSVQCGKRPVYIFSNNKFNKYAPVVNYYPLTSQIQKCSPVHVIVGKECGLKMKSAIMVECPGTLDKRNLSYKIGSCSREIRQTIFWVQVFQSEFCSSETLNKKLQSICV